MTSNSSALLFIVSVASDRLSSSDSSIVFGSESVYWSCTGESVEESSEERFSRSVFELFFLLVDWRGLACCVRGELVVRSVWCSCLLERVARFGVFEVELAFASCLAMVRVFVVLCYA